MKRQAARHLPGCAQKSCQLVRLNISRAGAVQGPEAGAHHVEVHVAVDLDADGRHTVVVLVVVLVVMPVAVAVAVIMAVVVVRRLCVAVVVSMLMLMVVAAVGAVLMAVVVAVVVAVLRLSQELRVHLRQQGALVLKQARQRYVATIGISLQVEDCTRAARQGEYETCMTVGRCHIRREQCISFNAAS